MSGITERSMTAEGSISLSFSHLKCGCLDKAVYLGSSAGSWLLSQNDAPFNFETNIFFKFIILRCSTKQDVIQPKKWLDKSLFHTELFHSNISHT